MGDGHRATEGVANAAAAKSTSILAGVMVRYFGMIVL